MPIEQVTMTHITDDDATARQLVEGAEAWGATVTTTFCGYAILPFMQTTSPIDNATVQLIGGHWMTYNNKNILRYANGRWEVTAVFK